MLGYGETLGGPEQAPQVKHSNPVYYLGEMLSNEKQPSAQTSAFDATVRIFEKQQNAIENELIWAREEGYRIGFDEARKLNRAVENQFNAIIENLRQQTVMLRNMQAPIYVLEQDSSKVLQLNAMIKSLQNTLEETRERNERQAETIGKFQDRMAGLVRYLLDG